MEQQLISQEEDVQTLEVCGANFATPVVDQMNYLDEIRYTIGGITYTTNAD